MANNDMALDVHFEEVEAAVELIRNFLHSFYDSFAGM